MSATQAQLSLEPAVPVSDLKRLCEIWIKRAREYYPKHATTDDLCALELQHLINKAEQNL